MAPDDQAVFISAVVLIAFLPPIFYAVILRNVERYFREPLGAVLRAFTFGAFVSVIIAVLLTAAVGRQLGNIAREYDVFEGPPTQDQWTLILVLGAAPIVEEFAKGLGVFVMRRRLRELEDGIVYGAAVGLGFSATENLFYEIAAIQQEGSGMGFVALVALRSVTSTFLHATASGIVGFGIARKRLQGGIFLEVLPFYVIAVALHSAFNALAIANFTGSAAVILVVSFLAIRYTVRRIRHLDRIPGIRYG